MTAYSLRALSWVFLLTALVNMLVAIGYLLEGNLIHTLVHTGLAAGLFLGSVASDSKARNSD